DRLVDHLLVFEGGGMIRDFPGNYSQYREDTRKNHSTRPPGAKAGTEKGQGQGQVKKIAAKSSFKEKRELELLEKEIQALESEKKQLEQQLQDPGASFETMAAWSSRLGEILVLLEQKMVRWLELGQVST
ncbi:MAG TPA: hypothetical protein VMV20_08105, partial [Chitinophagaceae bacterium]|nr:hypothetical protein [Chitinophagaceae bacterium]